MKHIKYMMASLFLLIITVAIVNFKFENKSEYPEVAVVSDAHVAAINSGLDGKGSELIYDPVKDEYLTVRSMQAQLTSTRLFNENYYAFITTLDELAKAKVKQVILNGDFTDDGQPMNLKAVADICKYYEQTYGMQFFALPGNHDPNKVVTTEGGKDDFLANNGAEFSIYSKDSEECTSKSADLCDDAIILNGYEGIYDYMKEYGFAPEKNYAYYATPYSSYDYKDYDYNTALEEAKISNRAYEICTEGTGGKYKQKDYTNCQTSYDLSYVVEPVKDVWIMAVDANVYVPDSPDTTEGSGDAGYNKMISHKTQTIEWMQDVAKEAKAQGKVLITSSHYPTVDFYNNSKETIAQTFGADGLSLDRNPTSDTSNAIADTNVGLTFSGHMHYNDTAIYEDEDSFLVNAATPSIAAYVPSYKIVKPLSKTKFEVTTHVLNDVKDFDSLFEYYQTEHQYRTNNKLSPWNEQILKVDNYRDFTNYHIQSLAELRHIDEWPEELSYFLKNGTLADILTYSNLNVKASYEDYYKMKKEQSPEYIFAKKLAEYQTKSVGSTLSEFDKISGVDLTADFYRLMNADELSQKDTNAETLQMYALLNNELNSNSSDFNPENNNDLANIFKILYDFSNDTASDHFIVDLQKKSVTDMSKNNNRINKLPNKQALRKIILKAEKIDEGLYTDASLKSLDKDLESAQQLYIDSTATQEKIDERTSSLTKSFEHLELIK